MKKLLCTFLVLLLTLSLIACNAGNGAETSGTPSGTSEPSGTSGTDDTPAETLAKVADTETPWYIEEWETDKPISFPEVPQDKENLALKMPQGYETESDGIKLSVDFHQEYYLAGSPIQVKITLTNESDEDFAFAASYPGLAAFKSQTDDLFFDYHYLSGEHEKEYYIDVYYVITSVGIVQIPMGESLTLEYLYVGEPDFFSKSETYTFSVKLLGEGTDDVYFEIPIEIVEVERVEESEST